MTTFSTVSVLVSVALALISCHPSRSAATKNEQLYGTWVSERSPEKIVMHSDGTFQSYLYRSDKSTWANGQFWIISKRLGNQNVIWYQINYLDKYPSDTKRKELGKLDMSTKVWEFDNDFVGDFEKDSFPTKIDKSHGNYRVYRWIGPE